MPTVITHSAVAVAAGAALAPERPPRRFWFLAVACSCLPDADVIGFSYGIAYGDFIGHRGFFHSPFFGLLLGIAIAALFFRNVGLFSRRWWFYAAFFALLSASHGILDALTNGGLGIALLAPFENSRYFFPWTPIPVAPLSLNAVFRPYFYKLLLTEIYMVWLPCLILALFIRWYRRMVRRSGRLESA